MSRFDGGNTTVMTSSESWVLFDLQILGEEVEFLFERALPACRRLCNDMRRRSLTAAVYRVGSVHCANAIRVPRWC
jgi:hypothetical protein